ncbi:MAG: thioredoxin family protein [Spirochaetes bacterium]|nr:thioredoxin family protein [Spirochaetota bacterium]MBU1079048.1 thioredoxin family protein [Spirochaetota bacterium]
MEPVGSYERILKLIEGGGAVAFYVSTPGCGVCRSLKPKVERLIGDNFPDLALYYVDAEALPEARGQLSAYAIPVVLAYFGGRECVRMARNFGIAELGATIDRYYGLYVGPAGPTLRASDD